MPWKATGIVEERMTFIARLEQGESMSALCREHGISRKTGYKIHGRYKELGVLGLLDQSRAPHERPQRTPDEIRERVLELRRDYGFGARKIRRKLLDEKVRAPATSTIGEILKEAGVVEKRRQRRRTPPCVGPFADAQHPNDRWTLDFKGEFRLGNRHYCYPLTVQDDATRYSIACQSLESTRGQEAIESLAEAFLHHGLPLVIRSDNGSPFAGRGLFGLTKLSAWLLKLGVQVERTDPGKPQQNGRHERFHRTLKADTTRPAAPNHLAQQERFDRFRVFYNHQRPHEALGDDAPADHYEPGALWNGRTPDPDYPLHDDVRRVTSSGHLVLGRQQRLYLSAALAGENVGLRELEDSTWLVSFAAVDLGHWNLATKSFEPMTPRRASIPSASKRAE